MNSLLKRPQTNAICIGVFSVFYIETVTSHILTPYPGTKLYERLKAAGRICTDDLEKYNTAHVVFKPANMTEAELYDGYLWMYRKFYSFRNIIRRFPESKKQRKAYLLFNLLYRKFGRMVSCVAGIIPMQRLGKLAARISYNDLPSAKKE